MISAKDVINGIDLHLFAFVWPQLCVKQTELVFDIRFRTEKEFKIYWEFVETRAKLILIYFIKNIHKIQKLRDTKGVHMVIQGQNNSESKLGCNCSQETLWIKKV